MVVSKYPPAEYTMPTTIPVFSGGTCREYVKDYVVRLEAALESCNADKASIRQWRVEDEHQDQD